MEETPRPPRSSTSKSQRRRSPTPFQRLADEQVRRLLILLRQEVRRNGGSLRELELSLGWRRGYLSQLLRGAIQLKAHHFFSLAKILDFDAGMLLARLCSDGEDEEDDAPEARSGAGEHRPARVTRTVVSELVREHLREKLQPARAEDGGKELPTNSGQPTGSEIDASREQALRLLAHLRQTIFDSDLTLRDLAKILGWGRGSVYATLSETAQVTLRCLFEVLAGLDEDPGRFFRRFFSPDSHNETLNGELVGAVAAGVVGGRADVGSAPFDEVSLLRVALRSLLAPLVAELVEEYLAGRLEEE